MSSPLPPWHRTLRRGRFEVRSFRRGPANSGRFLPVGEVARFADFASACEFADTLPHWLTTVDRVAPADVRYPEGPWQTTRVHQKWSAAS